MKIDLPPIPEADRTPLVEALLAVIGTQQQRLRQFEETVGQLRDEIAILKGQKPRPKIAPRRLEAPSPKPPAAPGDKRPGSSKRSENAFFAAPVEVKIPFPDPPSGSTSKGYEEYFIQELLIQGKVTRYLRERIVTPDGRALLARCPTMSCPTATSAPS